ncbi:MAG TPA: tRNA lysidine(34) synthetase TilS [Casimicrobiaceae bacterium]|nr:tRNA lysidine(34) synthetase TilS [Casimicrobiaceae bacterium]
MSAAVASAVREFVVPGSRVAVALSGGLDSMVLLDALSQIAMQHRLELRAVHVNHGLSPNAKTWADFCTTQCSARGVPLDVHCLTLDRRRANLEAIARTARYDRLCTSAADVIALAHHADDQAETVLLQLLRGAGPRGLSAMPRFRPGKPALLRPLLGLTRAMLGAYAADRGVAWIDDESNVERRHKRNFLRHDIAPLLAARFPGYPGTLVRAAELQAESSELLDALAARDGDGAYDAGSLERARLIALPPARARNLLRWFLHRQGLKPPSQARLAEMLRQLVDGAPDARTRIAHDGAELGCHRGRIAVHAPTAGGFCRVWHGEREVALPGGVLLLRSARGDGVSAAKLEQAEVTMRSRTGGERIQIAANRPRRALKRLLQEANVPPWLRAGLPLLWCGDELAAVPGIGVAVAYKAPPDDPGWALDWRPENPRRRTARS